MFVDFEFERAFVANTHSFLFDLTWEEIQFLILLATDSFQFISSAVDRIDIAALIRII